MATDYIVYCHRCPDQASSAHKRSTSMLIGSPDWGALWHCPDHTDCKMCPRGSWTDKPSQIKAAQR